MKRRIRLTESDMYAQQWKNELRCFMNGLKSGDYFVDNNTVYVQIWKKKTAQNDPRYVYFRKGENCLHDDSFSMQNSPRLSSRTLNTINSILGWDDEYMMSESKLRRIRLTESDLHRVIKESVKRILSERIKSEKGMTDDEVVNRRMKNYLGDREQMLGDNPDILDYQAEPEEGWYEYFNKQRKAKHNATQNHNDAVEAIEMSDVVRENLMDKIKEKYKEKQRKKDRERCKQAGEGNGKDYM